MLPMHISFGLHPEEETLGMARMGPVPYARGSVYIKTLNTPNNSRRG